MWLSAGNRRRTGVKFGVFDHIDRNQLPLCEAYEARLKIIESYERNGFYAYHFAEHHFTPIGIVPSPSVFMGAISQRTTTLRFGPFVYAMPFHHPLRLLEEICMLDQMSGGRIELGFGRGSVPPEQVLFGLDPTKSQAVYEEGLELILKGFRDSVLSFDGDIYHFKDIPQLLETLQKPHPPIWYGLHAMASAERAARKALHVVTNDTVPVARQILDHFRGTWRATHGEAPYPMMGLARFIVVGETDTAAMAMAERAYPRWFDSFTLLSRKAGRMSPIATRSETYHALMHHDGKGVAGSPETVTAFLREHLAETGATYLVGQFAFGELTTEETLRSIDLFSREVMPGLRREFAAAA
jgi:alkanesulfonate monooxygenase SsuD/methylene tetrahydromethanopterin reductase-like flavin-dependent oxidoreductase (luciferase family)